jgi:hypothetical protein
MNKILFFGLLLLNISNIFAGKELKVATAQQEKTLWCWAAACEIVLYAYGKNTDQYDVADWAVNGQNTTNDMHGTSKAVDSVIFHFASIGSNYDLSSLYEKYLIDQIDAGRPIMAGITFNGQIGHVVVIRGYSGSGGSNVGDVIFNDPGTGTREVWSYAKFVGNEPSWLWNETLRLTTNPPNPL